jgi:hypothetical protein
MKWLDKSFDFPRKTDKGLQLKSQCLAGISSFPDEHECSGSVRFNFVKMFQNASGRCISFRFGRSTRPRSHFMVLYYTPRVHHSRRLDMDSCGFLALREHLGLPGARLLRGRLLKIVRLDASHVFRDAARILLDPPLAGFNPAMPSAHFKNGLLAGTSLLDDKVGREAPEFVCLQRTTARLPSFC